MKNRILELSEFSLIATRSLQAVDKRFVCTVFVSNYSDKVSLRLEILGNKTTNIYFNHDPSIEELIEDAKKSIAPKFIKVKNICVDLIDKEVYIGEEREKVIVDSIARDGIRVERKCEDFSYEYVTVDFDEVYILEEV